MEKHTLSVVVSKSIALALVNIMKNNTDVSVYGGVKHTIFGYHILSESHILQ